MIREVLSLDQLQSMDPADAAALFAARRADGPSAHDAELLAAWLDLSPANAQAWARTETALRTFDDAADDELLDAMRSAARAARPTRRSPRLPLAAAAAVLVVLGGSLVVVMANRTGGPPASTVAEGQPNGAAAYVRVLAAAKGPPTHYDLPDGSRLTLEGGSTVEVAYAAARRDLRLVQGRAHFEVAHNRQRPFAVRAGDQEVVAVGTQFDVRLDPGRVRVVLTEGRVAVSRPATKAPPTLLAAGEELDAETGRDPVVRPADLEASRDWRDGVVSFDDTPLATAVAEFNRTSADQLVVRDPRVAQLRVSGRFVMGDGARFGRTLAQVHPVRVVETAPHRFEVAAAR